jgi:hypothetical protein
MGKDFLKLPVMGNRYSFFLLFVVGGLQFASNITTECGPDQRVREKRIIITVSILEIKNGKR